MSRESKTGGVPGGVSTALAMGVPNVPIIVWRCVEEVERRGLDIIGEMFLPFTKFNFYTVEFGQFVNENLGA